MNAQSILFEFIIKREHSYSRTKQEKLFIGKQGRHAKDEDSENIEKKRNPGST